MTRVCNVPNSTLQWLMRDSDPKTLQHLRTHESVPLIQARLPHNCVFPTISAEVVQHLQPQLEPSGRSHPSVTADTSASLFRIAKAAFATLPTRQHPIVAQANEALAAEALQPYRHLYSGPRTLHAALVNACQHPYAYRRCDCMWHPGQTCAAAHLGEFPSIVARYVNKYDYTFKIVAGATTLCRHADACAFIYPFTYCRLCCSKRSTLRISPSQHCNI
jgi:hypothetical protein